MQPADKLIARSPGLHAGVLHMGRHRSCSRLVVGQAGQIVFQRCKRDQRSPTRLFRGKLPAFESLIDRSARFSGCPDSIGYRYSNGFVHLVSPPPIRASSHGFTSDDQLNRRKRCAGKLRQNGQTTTKPVLSYHDAGKFQLSNLRSMVRFAGGLPGFLSP